MSELFTPIPTKWIEGIKIRGNVINETISAPLATYETPLWNSVRRGARATSAEDNAISVFVENSTMSRSVILRCGNTESAVNTAKALKTQFQDLAQTVRTTGRFVKLEEIHTEVVGNLLFVRFSFFTGDASGHNTATKAADRLIQEILEKFPACEYGSISGNFCTDKKPSAVNGILGRGRRTVAEVTLSASVLQKILRTDAEKICQLNLEKNLIGGIIAGSIRSANAHFANMLLAFYLATGQDAANIVEGSQGIVHCENRAGSLYFSCSLPNLIVGAIGNGKGGNLPVVEEALTKLGCREEREIGDNGNRIAAIAAAIALCGELSLLAAQTNPGELMRSHIAIERSNKT
ncbi:MAG: hydroxymethylglutaryl-CoA reductase [Cardiobacteriaceae bacterium]|nr:hydroxymethylglutaryl-CoA reductase [Cardiobacteriaceae bacterium]